MKHVARPWTTRVSTGHVVMVVAGLLGGVLTLTLLRGGDAGRGVVVAATDLAPGSVLDADSVRVSRVDADGDVLATLWPADDIAMLTGRVATGFVAEGALVARDDVRTAGRGPAMRSMSFPLERARALGGDLEAGDRVDVAAVDRDAGAAEYVMTDAQVLALDGDDDGPLGGPGDLTVTLAVQADEALVLAAALDRGTVTLVRATGAVPPAEGEDG